MVMGDGFNTNQYVSNLNGGPQRNTQVEGFNDPLGIRSPAQKSRAYPVITRSGPPTAPHIVQGKKLIGSE